MTSGVNTDLKPLLYHFDAFGWIPTIRGALSLDLMGQPDHMLGDVDRFSVDIPNYEGFTAEHYIAATSLHNVSDTKFGKDYVRNFRFFFYASIHDLNEGEKFITNLSPDENKQGSFAGIRSLITDEGVLLGHLFIVIEETFNLSTLEISVINGIKSLINMKMEYIYAFSHAADSLSRLDSMRAEMKQKWTSIRSDMDRLIDDHEKKTIHFEVFLTRDGIILLKDRTENPDTHSIYSVPGTPSDYTTHVQLHRVFKTAMNFVKFLFHKNYHHEKENDTFLPASNLHPFKKRGNFSRVFKHQIDSFLNPLMKLRRKGVNGFEHINIDPIGILNYCKSFVYTCHNNDLISQEKTKRELDYLSLLESDTNNTFRHSRSLLNSIASQGSILFVITTVLAFMVAVLTIFKSTISLIGDNPEQQLKFPTWHYPVLIIAGLAICGFLIVWYSHKKASKKDYHTKYRGKIKRSIISGIFFKDSDLDNQKLSWQLRFYIKLQDMTTTLFARLFRSKQTDKPFEYPFRLSAWAIRATIVFWLIVFGVVVYFIIKSF